MLRCVVADLRSTPSVHASKCHKEAEPRAARERQGVLYSAVPHKFVVELNERVRPDVVVQLGDLIEGSEPDTARKNLERVGQYFGAHTYTVRCNIVGLSPPAHLQQIKIGRTIPFIPKPLGKIRSS